MANHRWIVEMNGRGVQIMEVRDRKIRRILKWCFTQDLSKPLVSQMVNKITQAVHTRHKINYNYGYVLLNVKTGKFMVYNTNINSPWMERLSKTKEWLEDQEELRLQGEHINRPNTKWVFQRHFLVVLRVILDRQPLQIELGQLPDWIDADFIFSLE